MVETSTTGHWRNDEARVVRMSDIKIEDDMTRAKRGLSWLRLEDALHGTSCPICCEIENTERHYLEGMLYEYVLDAGVRKKLHSGHGLCTRHAHLAIEAEKTLSSDGLHLATMFETVLNEGIGRLNNQLEELRKLDNESRKQTPVHSIDVAKCFVCNFVVETERIALHGFVYFAKDNALLEDYRFSKSILCFRHVQMLVKERVDYRVIEVTLNKLEKVKEDMSNFIKKHDYQSAHDYTGDELQSYLAAVKFFSGRFR